MRNASKGSQGFAAPTEQKWGCLMVAPTIIGLLVLNIYPFIQTLYAELFQARCPLACYEFERHRKLCGDVPERRVLESYLEHHPTSAS